MVDHRRFTEAAGPLAAGGGRLPRRLRERAARELRETPQPAPDTGFRSSLEEDFCSPPHDQPVDTARGPLAPWPRTRQLAHPRRPARDAVLGNRAALARRSRPRAERRAEI